MTRWWMPVWMWFCLSTLAVGPAAGAETGVPRLEESLRQLQALTFCDEPVPLDDPDVLERMEKELLLSLWDRDQAVLWLKRSTRYLPFIEKRLAEAGLPDDLKYIALAESALRPHVGSPKGAIGFWQFMPETGRRYGLTVDARVDQRRNLAASTRAAIAYFRELHVKFGSWSLAATAFNMGEEGLQAVVERLELRPDGTGAIDGRHQVQPVPSQEQLLEDAGMGPHLLAGTLGDGEGFALLSGLDGTVDALHGMHILGSLRKWCHFASPALLLFDAGGPGAQS